MGFPVGTQKFPVRNAGNSSKKSRASRVCASGAERFYRNSLHFPTNQGIQTVETRSLLPLSTATLTVCYRTILCLSGTSSIRGRIPRYFRVLGFASKWQRQFRDQFRRAPLRKSLGGIWGSTFQFGEDGETVQGAAKPRLSNVRRAVKGALIVRESQAGCAVRSSRLVFQAPVASTAWR